MGYARSVSVWLYACCMGVFIMVIIGGLTRLTDSGLSIMTWEPLSGTVPPLDDAEWNRYFDEYKQIPQYQLKNKGMSLEEFKGIFWLEYFHRLWGRIIGLVFIVPLAYFIWKKAISKQLSVRLAGIFLIGLLQGFIGWYMVSSGFSERTEVSQYRLAMHLFFAFLIFALVYWSALDVFHERNSGAGFNKSPLAKASVGMSVFILFQVILGAFVAGTDAGFTYNTFPLMDGKLVPDGLYIQEPAWVNHFSNVAMVQFQHRVAALLLSVYICVFAFFYVRSDFYNLNTVVMLVVLLMLQIALGIITLHAFGSYADYDHATHAYKKVLHFPVLVAVAHQANSLLMFMVSLKINHRLLRG